MYCAGWLDIVIPMYMYILAYWLHFRLYIMEYEPGTYPFSIYGIPSQHS